MMENINIIYRITKEAKKQEERRNYTLNKKANDLIIVDILLAFAINLFFILGIETGICESSNLIKFTLFAFNSVMILSIIIYTDIKKPKLRLNYPLFSEMMDDLDSDKYNENNSCVALNYYELKCIEEYTKSLNDINDMIVGLMNVGLFFNNIGFILLIVICASIILF